MGSRVRAIVEAGRLDSGETEETLRHRLECWTTAQTDLLALLNAEFMESQPKALQATLRTALLDGCIYKDYTSQFKGNASAFEVSDSARFAHLATACKLSSARSASD